jgi:hypothetical protein
MKKVPITLPSWIGPEEAQNLVMRDLRAQALKKLEFYRSKMKPFEAKYATTFSRFQQRMKKAPGKTTRPGTILLSGKPITRGIKSGRNATLSCSNGRAHSRRLGQSPPM